MVRAARDIPAGAELSLSYLGPLLFAPAAVRQAELRQLWSFDCRCSRCKAEERYAGSSSSGSSLAQLLQETYTACQALGPQLDAAVEREDAAGVQRLHAQLASMQAAVEAGIRAANPQANVRRWLQACVYELYDLASLAADQLQQQQGPPGSGKQRRSGGGGGGAAPAVQVDTEALAACTRIVAALAPGSSTHVELATEYMVRSEARFGAAHQEAADAARACVAALTTRYGPLSGGMLQLFTDTWASAALI